MKNQCPEKWKTKNYTWPHRCELEEGHTGMHKCDCGEEL